MPAPVSPSQVRGQTPDRATTDAGAPAIRRSLHDARRRSGHVRGLTPDIAPPAGGQLSMAVVRRHVVVRGRVQGVFFRDSVRRLAAELAVAGWVRNTWDGTVEAVFEGEADAVERLVAFCRQGPSGARVEQVEVADAAPEGASGFHISG